jgi:hypothetical protein
MNLTRESLFEETQGVLDTLTDPTFIKRMVQFKSFDGESRLIWARENLTSEVLMANGVKMRPDMRLSSRVFEEDRVIVAKKLNIDKAFRLIKAIQDKRPDKIEKLRENYPSIYKEIEKYLSASNKLEILKDNDEDTVRDEHPDIMNESPWGCACGGTIAGCAGAGGGAKQ